MHAEAVSPSRRNRKVAIPHDAGIDKHRNQIESCVSRLKHFRRFATRYDRRIIISPASFTSLPPIASDKCPPSRQERLTIDRRLRP
ncbi:hypothetical protein [Sphingomonas sp. SAFR-052]|uniref:hypothetical protein n=1 Tax=Sphingomonas sp. SAFR-052 TaxID=3436867 RepID=UPI003F7DAF79